MKQLCFVLIALFSILKTAAYNPNDDNIHTIGKFVFEIEKNGNFETGFATLIGVKPNAELKGEITIPGSITVNGTRYVVNHIGYVYTSFHFFEKDRAFKDFPEITRVNIPSTITDIGYMEFLGCTGINEFHVNANNMNFKDEDGVLLYRWNEKSKWRLFRMPPARPKTKYTLPDDVTGIEQCAFADNKTLRQLILSPDFVFFDPLWAWGNKSIREIDISKTDYVSRDGIIFEVWEEGSVLIACPPGLKLDSYTIPKDCHKIEQGAFCFSSVSHIKFHNYVLLTDFVFAGSDLEELECPIEVHGWSGRRDLCLMASKLKRVHISSSDNDKVEIGDFAFAQCPNLTEIEFDSRNVQLLAGAFQGCSSLKTFPFSNVSFMEGGQIGSFNSGRQFEATGLETVNFPSSINLVPSYCFHNCSDLKEVVLNEKNNGMTTDLGDGAFKNCTSLETINLKGINLVGGGTFDGTPISKIIVPARTATIGELKIGLSFGFLPDTKWYIDSPCLRFTSAHGSYNLTEASYIVSTFQKIITVPTHWKQVYCPGGMKEWYESLYEGHNWGGPVTEMFSMEKDSPSASVLIVPNSEMDEISFELTGVSFNGIEAQCDEMGRWFNPNIRTLSGVEIKVDYRVDDVPLSTTYPADYISKTDTITLNPPKIIGIYDLSGKIIECSVKMLPHGIYILKYSDGRYEKIIR